MRPLQVQVRTAELDRVLAAAEKHGAHRPLTVRADPLRAEGQRTDERWSLVLLHLPNENVGAFVEDVRQDLDDPQFILLPVGALPLETPLSELDPRISDVSRLSTLELVIASLQSIGAWRGMLVFSVLAGIIGAYGLIFDIGYVLVAAMLVNPMGAPALVSVIGIAIGDVHMFRRGALRFAVSLLVQAGAALALGFAYGLAVSTAMMEQVTSLSNWAVLIALAAGAAGAQALAKSERDSLVSGTAAGFMVAAALAPPAAVMGLAVPLGRWDYFSLMAFLLALQYLAIVIGGWAGLTLIGVRPAQPSVGRGNGRTRSMLLAGVTLATIGFVFLQTRLEPRFLKADLSRIGLEIARESTADRSDLVLLSSSAAFTRHEIGAYEGQAMLMEVIVERRSGTETDDSIAAQLRRRVVALVAQRMKDVVPFVDVTVLPGPEPPGGREP